jgi:hypothetical protein
MADRFRRTFPIAVKFSKGEIPPAEKLDGLSSQARNGLNIVEQAIGDIWNQSGDPVLSPIADPTSNALFIPNIARALGSLSSVSPRFPSQGITAMPAYKETISAQGKKEAFLHLPPVTPSTITLGGSFAPLALGGYRATLKDIDATGEWNVDTRGRITTFDPMPASFTMTYTPVTSFSDVATSATYNVIPDKASWSGAYAGLKVSYVNDMDGTAGYLLFLPPRMSTSSSLTYFTPDITNNTTATPDSGSLTYWQSGAANASLQAHYRYNLPPVLSALTPGTTIPVGFLYLWDNTRSTIVEGVVFKVPSSQSAYYVLEASGIELDTLFLPDVTSSGSQVPGDYKARWKIITIGSSVASSVSAIANRFGSHSHKASDGVGSRPVSHNDLADVFTPAYNASTNPNYPSTGHDLFNSYWSGDDHPQYLHRKGFQNNSTKRDMLDNAMLGDLVIAPKPSFGLTNALHINDDSYAIRFGEILGPRISFRVTPNSSANLYSTFDYLLEILGGNTAGKKSILIDSNGEGLILNAWRLYLTGKAPGSIGSAPAEPIFSTIQEGTSYNLDKVQVLELRGGGATNAGAPISQSVRTTRLQTGSIVLNDRWGGTSSASLKLSADELDNLLDGSYATDALGTTQLHKHKLGPRTIITADKEYAYSPAVGPTSPAPGFYTGNRLGIITGQVELNLGTPTSGVSTLTFDYENHSFVVGNNPNANGLWKYRVYAGSFKPSSSPPICTFVSGQVPSLMFSTTLASTDSVLTIQSIDHTNFVLVLKTPGIYSINFMLIGLVDNNAEP